MLFRSLNALLNDKRGITANEYIEICRVLNLPLDYFTADAAATAKNDK